MAIIQEDAVLPKEANLAREEESDGDSRVDVSTADVSEYPDNRSDAHTERQRNPDDVTCIARAAGDDNE